MEEDNLESVQMEWNRNHYGIGAILYIYYYIQTNLRNNCHIVHTNFNLEYTNKMNKQSTDIFIESEKTMIVKIEWMYCLIWDFSFFLSEIDTESGWYWVRIFLLLLCLLRWNEDVEMSQLIISNQI